MKVILRDNGWLECDTKVMVAGTVTGSKADPTPAVRWIRIPVFAVLVDVASEHYA